MNIPSWTISSKIAQFGITLINMNFSKIIKKLRLEYSLSQKELGEKFGISYSAVNHWENRGSEPDFETLCKIAKFFGVTTDYLLGLED